MTRRIVHLGLGNFFKAHSAWYTQISNNESAEKWEIAAFTGRSPDAAQLHAQHANSYTLLVRDSEKDSPISIDCVVEAHSGTNQTVLSNLIASPDTSIVTLTITESGYTTKEGGAIDRLVHALQERFSLGETPIAIVPCDNVAENGSVVRSLFSQLSANSPADFQHYLLNKVSIVSTSVDRITPKTEENLRGDVVTEPFSSWVLQGNFPLGRPAWEKAGATFVEDLSPYVLRKLFFLNGAHSLLAYAGINKGHVTVDQAIHDVELKAAVENYWRDAAKGLEFSVEENDAYQKSLISRFENPRISHALAQIAIDGSLKLPQRIVATSKRLITNNENFQSCVFIFAAWISFLLQHNFQDAQSDRILAALAHSDPVKALVEIVDSDLPTHTNFLSSIREAVDISIHEGAQ